MAHWSGHSYAPAFPPACEGHSRSQSPTQQPISRPGFTDNILRETRDSAAWAHLPEVVVYKPDLDGVCARWQATERYYARNQAIVHDSDRIIAFAAPDRAAGTEDTIRRAERAGKPVELR
jgi:hypothetical protein